MPPSRPQKRYDKFSPPSINHNLNNVINHKNNVRFLKAADINDAVELSIAASEALLIHELVESDSTTNSLSVSAILEVALRVKKARLEGYEEELNISQLKSSDFDYVSDLDESTMADAYEEVGLSVSAVDQCISDSIISQVKDTFSAENSEPDEKLSHKELCMLFTDAADVLTKQQSNGFDVQLKGNLTLEPVVNLKQKKIIDNVAQGLETSNMAFDMNFLKNCSANKNSDISFTAKRVDSAMEDVTTFQVTSNSLPGARISKDDGRIDLSKAPDRFQSRWLGGWAQKNIANTSVMMQRYDVQSKPEYIIAETSLLSESDIVPDGNSFVCNQDKSGIVSQESVPSKSLCTKDDQKMYLYEDAVNSCTPSVDPLCSVVPCSISSQDACSTLAQNKDVKAKMEKCFSFTPDYTENNLLRSVSNDMEVVNRQVPTVRDMDSEPMARRQVASLRTYSMLTPSCGTYFGRENKCCDKSLPSQCNVNMIQTDASNNDRPAKDKAELFNSMHEETGPLLNLNLEKGCFLKSSKPSLRDTDGGENPEHISNPERDVEMPQIKNLQISGVSGQKRVHFAEADISFPKKKRLQMMQMVHANRSTRRNDRLKRIYPHSESGVQEVKRRPSNCLGRSFRRLIFERIEFLLTGFSTNKEKEIEGLIRKNGGIVLSTIPSPPSSRALRSSRSRHRTIPIILCPKKLQTVKFLYGCAVKTYVLTDNWLVDSISAGSVLPPERYMLLPNLCGEKYSKIGKSVICNKYIFDNIGVMFHGNPTLCIKMANVIKHGGGLVVKTLHWLIQSLVNRKISVGAIITDDESKVSRHLKHCAAEWKIPMMSDSWIINSLYAGKLLPLMKSNHLNPSLPIKLPDSPVSIEKMSEEI